MDLCFYDVMLTFKGERQGKDSAVVGDFLAQEGAVVGQYEPLDERGVTAVNYLILGLDQGKAVMADRDGRLSNSIDVKDLLLRASRETGAAIVYVTKLSETSVDFEEFSDIEDADAALDLAFRQARSVAIGRIERNWVRDLAADTYQDVHLLTQEQTDTALIDGGLDVASVPAMNPRSAFVYTTPLAMLVRLFLPPRTPTEVVHETSYTWFAPTRQIRRFSPESEASKAWGYAMSRLQDASAFAEDLASNPETSTPTDAAQLWSAPADIRIVESVVTAAGLPGRSVRFVEHEGRAENLPGVRTVKAESDEVRSVAVDRQNAGEPTTARAVVEHERSLLWPILAGLLFVALGVTMMAFAFKALTAVPMFGAFFLAVVFFFVAISLGKRAYKIHRSRSEN